MKSRFAQHANSHPDKIVSICHTLDPGRAVTQALFRPSDNGDVTGATGPPRRLRRATTDPTTSLRAMAMAPARAGVLTEMGTETTTWTTVTATPALTGSFMWTGVTTLANRMAFGEHWPLRPGAPGRNGELPGRLPSLGRGSGEHPRPPSAPGQTAGMVVLAADHAAITTDVNDVSFVKAAVPPPPHP